MDYNNEEFANNQNINEKIIIDKYPYCAINIFYLIIITFICWILALIDKK